MLVQYWSDEFYWVYCLLCGSQTQRCPQSSQIQRIPASCCSCPTGIPSHMLSGLIHLTPGGRQVWWHVNSVASWKSAAMFESDATFRHLHGEAHVVRTWVLLLTATEHPRPLVDNCEGDILEWILSPSQAFMWRQAWWTAWLESTEKPWAGFTQLCRSGSLTLGNKCVGVKKCLLF